ncbi:MAG: hypothetical protein P8I92_00015 [Schleiferiaceae bacterium]|nr:hypothetical protein [Schleiferiaceae bacterium]
MNSFYDSIFSDKTRNSIQTITTTLAVLGFIIHLILIGLSSIAIIDLSSYGLFDNPINSIYTPFSFILIYEIYLLVFYLPRSFTTSLLKQFEIISLILVRRVFADITKIDFTTVSMANKDLKSLFVDLLAVLVLALTILLFYKAKSKLEETPQDKFDLILEKRFNNLKKYVSSALIIILGCISVVHLIDFLYSAFYGQHLFASIKNDLNSIFYKDFFTALILTDVLILLLSYSFFQDYFRLLRNTGFVIATILIRLSFGVAGILNIILILSSAAFGYAILLIYINYRNSPQIEE